MQNLLRQSIGAAPARGRHATLGIRPQYVSVSDGVEDAALSGEVVMTRRRGTDMIVDPEFPDGSRVIASLPETGVFGPGPGGTVVCPGTRASLPRNAGLTLPAGLAQTPLPPLPRPGFPKKKAPLPRGLSGTP